MDVEKRRKTENVFFEVFKAFLVKIYEMIGSPKHFFGIFLLNSYNSH